MWLVAVQHKDKDYVYEFDDEYLARSFYDACLNDETGNWHDQRIYLSKVEAFGVRRANLVVCSVCKGKGCLPPDEGGSVCTACNGMGSERKTA